MSHSDDCQLCGTISHGTLREEDLIPVFAETLSARLDELAAEQRARRRPLSPELHRALADLEELSLRADEPGYLESDDAGEDLGWLEEALSHYAPPGHWFGAHPGDGSDFGFWPLELLGEDGGDGETEGEPSGEGEARDGELRAPGAKGARGAAERSGGPGNKAATAREPEPEVFPEFSETHVETWFERDRAHVALYDSRTNNLLIEWWDEDVAGALEDGFLDRRDYHRSAYDYAHQML